MTAAQNSAARVPADTFGVRLAIVRTVMRWNYDDAERATGINSESWRTWERGVRRCSDTAYVGRVLEAVTGYDWRWIVTGGSLAPDHTATRLPGSGRRLNDNGPRNGRRSERGARARRAVAEGTVTPLSAPARSDAGAKVPRRARRVTPNPAVE